MIDITFQQDFSDVAPLHLETQRPRREATWLAQPRSALVGKGKAKHSASQLLKEGELEKDNSGQTENQWGSCGEVFLCKMGILYQAQVLILEVAV